MESSRDIINTNFNSSGSRHIMEIPLEVVIPLTAAGVVLVNLLNKVVIEFINSRKNKCDPQGLPPSVTDTKFVTEDICRERVTRIEQKIEDAFKLIRQEIENLSLKLDRKR
jgi:NAD-specific glutamate dehydrogenase